jgi:hypothetical protein
MLKNPVTLDPTLEIFLQVGSGLFWTLTYLLILRRGYQDKTYGMPVLALCANLSWEFTFSFVFPHPQPQLYINYVWLLFDIGILIQFFLYGRPAYPRQLPAKLFYPAFLLMLLFSALTIILISYEFDEFIGIYAAFGQNLLMSVLFISMLLHRNSLKGQSIYIALFKMIGTILPSLLFYFYFPASYLLIMLYLAILTYDIIYFTMLYHRTLTAGINPWRRL